MPEERARLVSGIRAALALIVGTKLEKAARLGVSDYTIDRWNAGSSAPSEKNLTRIARLAGVEQEDIRNNTVGVAE